MENGILTQDDLLFNDGGDELDLEDNDSTEKHWVLEDGTQQPEPVEDPEELKEEGTDVVAAYLRAMGVDPYKIKFEDQTGLVSEKSFNELTAEEQYNVLLDAHKDPATDLDKDEVDLINEIRKSKLNPKLYIEASINKGISEKVEETPYDIDGLKDEEVFLVDLQSKIPDISEEDAQKALESAKANPSIFERLIQGLRNEFKQQEELQRRQLAAEEEAAKAAQYLQFEDSIVNNVYQLKNIGNLDINLEKDDMEDIASFILDSDENTGMSYLAQALEDPKTLVETAWFILKGREAFDGISDYMAQQIMQARQNGYNQGLASIKPQPANKVVRQQVQPTTSEEDDDSMDNLHYNYNK